MGHPKPNSRKSKLKRPKTVLRLLDLEHSKSAVLNSLGAVGSQESYGHAIDEFITWYCSEPRLSFSRTVVLLPNTSRTKKSRSIDDQRSSRGRSAFGLRSGGQWTSQSGIGRGNSQSQRSQTSRCPNRELAHHPTGAYSTEGSIPR